MEGPSAIRREKHCEKVNMNVSDALVLCFLTRVYGVLRVKKLTKIFIFLGFVS